MRSIFCPGMNNSHLEFLRILQGHVSQQVQIGIPSMSSGNQWTPHCAKSCKFKSPRSRNSEMQLIIEFHTTLRRMVPSAKSLAGPGKTLLKHVFFLHFLAIHLSCNSAILQGFEASMLHQHTFCCLLCFLASSCRGLSDANTRDPSSKSCHFKQPAPSSACWPCGAISIAGLLSSCKIAVTSQCFCNCNPGVVS